MITLITPTRDRPEALELCEKYMSKQTYRGSMQWIVVDDGDVPIKTTMGQDYIRRQPSGLRCTLPQNLIEAVKIIDPASEAILFIEDDDWYAPAYVAKMVEILKGHEIAGLGYHRYYNVFIRMWSVFNNMNYAALCNTVIARPLLDWLVTCCEATIQNNDAGVDARLWAAIHLKEHYGQIVQRHMNSFMLRNDGLSVGIKAMAGRGGLTGGHGSDKGYFPNSDPYCDLLRVWIGEDAEAYLCFGAPYLPRKFRDKPIPICTLSVVIHNKLAQFREFLKDAYKKCNLALTEIIVSDNASTDDTPVFRLDNEVPIPGMPDMRWVRYENEIDVSEAHLEARRMARSERFIEVGENLYVPAL